MKSGKVSNCVHCPYASATGTSTSIEQSTLFIGTSVRRLPGGYPDLLEANPEPDGRWSGSTIGEPDPHVHTLGDQDVIGSLADLHAGEPNEVVTDPEAKRSKTSCPQPGPGRCASRASKG
jgi:hypothetical protein